MKKILGWLTTPEFQSWFHGALVAFWIAVWVYAGLTGLLKSVVFVSHLSAAALVLASLAALQAARAEVRQKRDNGDEK